MTAVLYRIRALLRSRWPSTLAMTAVVAITGGLALTLVAGAVRTSTSPDRYADKLDLGLDITVNQDYGLPRTDELRRLPAVASAESATFVFGFLGPAESGEVPPDGLVFAGSHVAIGGRIVEGRAADPSTPGEFVAGRSFVQASNATIGTSYVLYTVSTAQAAASGFDVATPEGPAIAAKLVGVFEDPSSLQDVYPLSVFSYSLLDAGDIGVSATVGALGFAPEATAGDLREQLDALPNGEIFSILPIEVVPEAVRNAVETQAIGLLVLAVIVSAAGLVVTGQMLGREVRVPKGQRSALHTLGMTSRQLTLESMGRAAVPILFGAIIAALSAVSFSGLFPAGFARPVEPDPGVRFDPLVHLVGPLLLAIALVGWLSAVLVGRDRRGERAGGAERATTLVPWLRPPQAATAMRFTFSRHPGDVGSPKVQTAGLLVVLALAVAAITFGANVGQLIDEPARSGSSDLGIGQGGGEIPQRVADLLAADSDVAALTRYGVAIVSVGSESLGVVGSEAVVGLSEPIVLAGRLPIADDEVALGRVSARRLGAGLGDVLDIVGSGGAQTLRVTGLAVIPGIEDVNGMGEGGFVSLAGLRRLDASAPLSSAFLELRDGVPADTAERLSTLSGVAIGPNEPVAQTLNLGRVRSLPNLLLAVLVLLAVLSMAHLLIQSARQRRRDVAILRALGATRAWVTSVVHWQASILTLSVFILAVPLGFIVGRAAYRLVANRIGAPTDVFLPALSLGVVLATLLVLANLAAAVPSRRVRRNPPADYLNRE